MGYNKEDYRLIYVDRVLDPVHGFIDLTRVEKEIIDLPIFRRLGSIKQLSLTNWIFPGAEHTRYIHSLGVMHIVDLMAKNLKRLDGTPRFGEWQRQILRLAGLLHDIGHYPLSHLTEDVYIHAKELEPSEESLLNEYHKEVIADIEKLKRKSTPEYMKSRYSKDMHHEKMGTEVIRNDNDIKRIIQEQCAFVSIDDICDIIVGYIGNVQKVGKSEVNQDLSVMVQLMHAEVDADGIDYLLRDATFSGTSYGKFELGLLLRNLVVGQYDGVEIVGIQHKGISVMDQYLINKYFSYTQVIFNRHVTILEIMAQLFVKHLLTGSAKGSFLAPDNLLKIIAKHEEVDDYLDFTDRKFWTLLYDEDLSHANLNGEFMKIICEKLKHYRELDLINEKTWTSSDSDGVYYEITNDKMYKKLLTKPENYIYTFQKKSFTSELQEEKYREILTTEDAAYKNEAMFKKENLKRLQEGIAIIDDVDGNPHLLVDDLRSVMGVLGKTSTYIFREYKIY